MCQLEGVHHDYQYQLSYPSSLVLLESKKNNGPRLHSDIFYSIKVY